jgi:4-diphosphocytidyl-2-C-methyl-D-erythritol kinase
MTERTSITVNSPAKINLTFEILGLLPDGYHEVRTLMQTVSLFDELTFEIGSAKEPSLSIELITAGGARSPAAGEGEGQFPLGDTNLIARAIRLFLSSIDRPRALKVDVTVAKHIPIGAGLAGGSGNAAAALVALNQYFGGPLGDDAMAELAAKLGADVPFCLQGGRRLGLGRGDILDSTPQGAPDDSLFLDGGAPAGVVATDGEENDKEPIQTMHFVLAKTRHLSLATPWVYQSFDQKMAQQEILSLADKLRDRGVDALPCDYAQANLQGGNLKEALRAFGNDFEQVVFPHYQQLKEIKQRFLACGALACHMTGSGPTIYAVAESAAHANELIEKYKESEAEASNIACAAKYDQIDLYAVRSINVGARVVQVGKI